MPGLKTWEISLWGMAGYYCAVSRARARYLGALAIDEAGWCSVREALVKMKCRRAAWKDLDAECRGREGCIGASDGESQEG